MKKLCGCILRIKKATLLKDYWRFNRGRGQDNRGAELYDLFLKNQIILINLRLMI